MATMGGHCLVSNPPTRYSARAEWPESKKRGRVEKAVCHSDPPGLALLAEKAETESEGSLMTG